LPDAPGDELHDDCTHGTGVENRSPEIASPEANPDTLTVNDEPAAGLVLLTEMLAVVA